MIEEEITVQMTEPPRHGNRSHRRAIVSVLTAIVGVLTIAILAAFWVASHHVVYTEHGTALLRKRFMTLDETRIDIRNWTAEDFLAHPQITAALRSQGYGDLVASPPLPETRSETAKRRFREYSGKTRERMQTILQRSQQWITRTPQQS